MKEQIKEYKRHIEIARLYLKEVAEEIDDMDYDPDNVLWFEYQIKDQIKRLSEDASNADYWSTEITRVMQ